MTTAIIPRHARPPGRLAWAWGLTRLAAFLAFHPSAPVPSGLLNVRIADMPRGMRLTDLDSFAGAYRVKVTKKFGRLAAERRFGPVVIEAHIKDEDYSAQLAAGMVPGNEATA